MKNFSLKQIIIIYNYLERDININREEKLIIAYMLLNSLEQIKCFNNGYRSCFHCYLDEKDEYEIEIKCEFTKNIDYSFRNYSLSRMENCPFENLENDVKKLIKELNK